MRFSVIYSIDCAKNLHITQFYPPQVKFWDMTESDDNGGDYDDIFTRGAKHRKFCAWLSKDHFLHFVDKCNIYADSTETMGSLGAPGMGYGISPAISFSCDSFESSYGNDHEDYGYICNAYVTPVPCYSDESPLRADGMSERDWERLRSVILAMFH